MLDPRRPLFFSKTPLATHVRAKTIARLERELAGARDVQNAARRREYAARKALAKALAKARADV